MVTHYGAAKLGGRQLQARALVESGVEAVRLYLMQIRGQPHGRGWPLQQPELLSGHSGPHARRRVPNCANFTVLAPNLDEAGNLNGVRYGLEDESTRLNVNALVVVDQLQENAGRDLLLGLPGMTEDVADAILDWMDEDDEPREYGAESSYYQGTESALHRPRTVRWTRSRSCCWCAASHRSCCSAPTPIATAWSTRTRRAARPCPGCATTTASPDAGARRRWHLHGSRLVRVPDAAQHGKERECRRDAAHRPEPGRSADALRQPRRPLNEDWAKFIILYRQNGRPTAPRRARISPRSVTST